MKPVFRGLFCAILLLSVRFEHFLIDGCSICTYSVSINGDTTMTIEEVKERVSRIERIMGDTEAARLEEAELWADVLDFIASGWCDNHRLFASAALQTKQTTLTRWYA